MLHLMSGMSAENDGDLEQMEINFPLALNGFREIGDRWGIGAAVGSWANLASARGDTEAAITALEEARRMMTDLRAKEDEAYSLIRIGVMRLRLPDLEGARRDIEAGLRIADESGAPTSVAFANFGMAVLAHLEGRDDEARQLAEGALATLDRAPFAPPQVKAVILAGLATYDIEQGSLGPARARLAAAFECVRATRDMPVGAIVSNATAHLLAAGGQPERAAELLGVSVSLRGMEDWGDHELRRISATIEAELGTEDYARIRAQGQRLSRTDGLALLESSLAAPDQQDSPSP
jgi:tetratricopeptide (TPR) repeat protein